MDEERIEEQEYKEKPAWQARKESWYDHLTVTVKQLDMIIAGASVLLVGVVVLIALDAMGIIGS